MQKKNFLGILFKKNLKKWIDFVKSSWRDLRELDVRSPSDVVPSSNRKQFTELAIHTQQKMLY